MLLIYFKTEKRMLIEVNKNKNKALLMKKKFSIIKTLKVSKCRNKSCVGGRKRNKKFLITAINETLSK